MHSQTPENFDASLGITTHLVFILVAGVIVSLGAISMITVYGLWLHKGAHLLVTMLGFALLTVSFLAWAFAAGRGLTPASTGAGFVICASALALRGAVDMLLALAWRSPDEVLGDPGADQLVLLARQGGIVAFATGLMLVAGCCIAERRARRALDQHRAFRIRPIPGVDYLRTKRRWSEPF